MLGAYLFNISILEERLMNILETLYYWVIDFMESVGAIFNWLITPIDIFGSELIAPIYAIVGAIAITGLIRRIL